MDSCNVHVGACVALSAATSREWRELEAAQPLKRDRLDAAARSRHRRMKMGCIGEGLPRAFADFKRWLVN